MADDNAVPERAQEKVHGDKLDNVLNTGTGSTQGKADKSSEPVPQTEPLK